MRELAEEVRAGSRVLSLFANPLNVRVLRAYDEGPKQVSQVREAVGWAAASTVRTAVVNLCEIGAVARVEDQTFGRGAVNALTAAGRELLFVAAALQAWFDRFPERPIALDSDEAKSAVKALAGGWSSALIRELATCPTTLGDLNGALPETSYPALERRLDWMKMTGQIEALEGDRRGVPYRPTDLLRRAIAPLTAAGRCERRLPAFDAPPVTNVEVEAALLLFLPLAPLPHIATGECLLAVQTDPVPGEAEGDDPGYAGVTVSVEAGELRIATPAVPRRPPSWTVSSVDGWLDAVLDGRLEELRIGGADRQLALDLVAGLHMAHSVDP